MYYIVHYPIGWFVRQPTWHVVHKVSKKQLCQIRRARRPRESERVCVVSHAVIHASVLFCPSGSQLMAGSSTCRVGQSRSRSGMWVPSLDVLSFSFFFLVYFTCCGSNIIWIAYGLRRMLNLINFFFFSSLIASFHCPCSSCIPLRFKDFLQLSKKDFQRRTDILCWMKRSTQSDSRKFVFALFLFFFSPRLFIPPPYASLYDVCVLWCPL
jgi:hypothetical protein